MSDPDFVRCQGRSIPLDALRYRGRPVYRFPALNLAPSVAVVAWRYDDLLFQFETDQVEVVYGIAPHGGIPRHTPWGDPDSVDVVADGIVFYGTPSHGGYWLSESRAVVVRNLYEIDGFKTMNAWTWYEEDCDSCLVPLAFPELFPRNDVRRAARFANGWKKELSFLWSERFKRAYPSHAKLWRNHSARVLAHWRKLCAMSDEDYARGIRLWRSLSRGRRLCGVTGDDARFEFHWR